MNLTETPGSSTSTESSTETRSRLVGKTTVEVNLDSYNSAGERLTTFILQYPRFIHSQLLTHRAFSRNSASSRAIPVQKVIDGCNASPAFPAVWQRNKPGMSGGETFDHPDDIRFLDGLWERARLNAIDSAEQLLAAGVHKQWVNRLLEPFSYITTIVTSCSEGLDNFFTQRCGDAQPEIMELACLMRARWSSSVSNGILKLRSVHAPLTTPIERTEIETEKLLQLSVARAARVSYLNHDGSRPDDRDYELFNKLKEQGHWSPFEHAAVATPGLRVDNFTGWTSARRLLK